MVLTATFAAAQLYLGVDHPFDVAVSIAFAVAILLNAFRFFTPNEVFPVTYRRGKTAHLDVSGRRGEAIRRAVQDQLGLTVLDASRSAWPAPADRRRCGSGWRAIRTPTCSGSSTP